MADSTRKYFFNSWSTANGTDSVETKALLTELANRLNVFDGARQPEVYQDHVEIRFVPGIVTTTELDALVIPVITATAKQPGLFPFVKSDGTLKRSSSKKNKGGKKLFHVTPTHEFSRPSKQRKPASGRQSVTRVYEFNALIAGMDHNGAYQEQLQEQFGQIFGGHIARVNGAFKYKTYVSQIAVRFYEDMTPVGKMDKRAEKILMKIFNQHHQFFPHLRAAGRQLEITRVFSGSDI